MKLQLTFTTVDGRKFKKNVLMKGCYCIGNLLSDEAILRIYNTQFDIKYKCGEPVLLIGIRDIDTDLKTHKK